MLGDLKLEAMNATLGRKLEGQIFEREQHQQTVRQLQDNLHTMERKVRWTYGTQRMKEINDISRLERVIGRMILERFGMRVWHRARMAMRRRWHQWLEVMLLRKYRLQSMQDLLLRHWRTVLTRVLWRWWAQARRMTRAWEFLEWGVSHARRTSPVIWENKYKYTFLPYDLLRV